MRFAFFFLIAFLCSWNSAKAQELPSKIQGNWASPDCGRYSEGLILSRHFYLKSTKKDMTLLPARKTGEKADYLILSLGGEQRPTRLEDDGILKIGVYGEKAAAKNWDDLQLDSHMEYTACTDAPAIVPKMMARLMRYIDRIGDQCTVSLKNDCARVLFKMTDANSDKKITPSEIKRTVANALLFGELAARKTVPDASSEKLVALSKTEGQKIADDLMKKDANKSGNLDYNELVENFTPPELPIVKETLLKMGNLLPAFKVAAAALK